MPGGGVDVDLPSPLIQAARDRMLLPFIGAGFSKNISPQFPDWRGVIDIAADILQIDRELLRLHGDYLQIAEYLEVEKGGIGELANRLVKKIDDENLYSVNKSRPHLLLPYIDCNTIYTTNWDRWIERGFDDQGFPYSQIRNSGDLSRPEISPSKEAVSPIYNKEKRYNKRINKITRIIKFHGDFSDHNSLVIRESDYFNRMSFEDPLDIDLRSQIYGKSVLFIGYSFSDLNMRLMWNTLSRRNCKLKNPIKSFFLTSQYNPLLSELLSQQHVEVIYLDPIRTKESVTDVLEKILNYQERDRG